MPIGVAMTRKDFVLIAEIVRLLDVSKATRLKVAEEFAHGLRITNGNFEP